MLKDLFVNATILISFLFVGSQFFKNRTVNSPSLNGKLLLGFMSGVLSITLMVFSIHITSSTLLDFRHIPIIISALYSGIFSSMITGIMIFFFRIFFFGVTTSGIIAAINMFIVSITCGLISNIKSSEIKKFHLMTLSSLSIISTTFIIVLKGKTQIETILLIFWISSLIVGYMTYYLSRYIKQSIILFNKLSQESKIDFLTGLNNVRQFDALINNAIENSKIKKERLSFLMIDIDFFKKINDTYGHPAGDAVLKELSMVLSENCRSFDEVSRVGGEEFSAILPDCPKAQAFDIAERLRLAVEKHSFTLPDGKKINITVSIGLSSYPETTDNLDTIIKEADLALYKAKQSGRNKVSI